MPIRLAHRAARQEGPPPFSSAWIQAPPVPPAPRRTLAFPQLTLPAWLPGERDLTAAFVLLLVTSIALVAGGDPGPVGDRGSATALDSDDVLSAPGAPAIAGVIA